MSDTWKEKILHLYPEGRSPLMNLLDQQRLFQHLDDLNENLHDLNPEQWVVHILQAVRDFNAEHGTDFDPHISVVRWGVYDPSQHPTVISI